MSVSTLMITYSPGIFVPRNESSRGWMFHGTKVPWNIRPRERNFPGTKVPGNESSTLRNFRPWGRKFHNLKPKHQEFKVNAATCELITSTHQNHHPRQRLQSSIGLVSINIEHLIAIRSQEVHGYHVRSKTCMITLRRSATVNLGIQPMPCYAI